MNAVFWVGIAFAAALLALGGEWAMGIRERRIRVTLEQPLDGSGKERKRLYQLLFATFLLASFFGLALAGAHRQWVRTVQGVSVVLDTAAFPSEGDPARQLSIEKGAVTELIRALPGVTISLYELRGGVVHLVVPPTIDRLFFELQLDGVLSSPSVISDLSLSAIQKNVVERFSGPPPWVVVVSPVTVKPGAEDLDGVATIEVQKDAVLCSVREEGLTFKGLTVEHAALKIVERLSRSTMPIAPDTTEKFLLVACTGLALFCFVMWRKANIPLFALSMILVACPQAFSVSDVEANGVIRDASSLAGAKDFEASQKMVESLLTTVASPQGRQRLLYDRALLSYLQGKDADALLWLAMQSSTEPQSAMAEGETLRGLSLTRLVETSANEGEQLQWKKSLREWLEKDPKVSQEIVARATIALFSPLVHVTDMEAVRRTLRWLEENAQGVAGPEKDPLVSAAALLAQETKGRVEQQLNSTWPKGVASLFVSDMSQKQNAISTVRIWYDFALAPTPNEAVEFLLAEASMSAQIALFFPQQRAAANKDLGLVSSLLNKAASAISEQHQGLLRWLLSTPTGDGEQRAASWYARAALWPAMLSYDPKQLKSIALLLCREIDACSSVTARKTIAALIASACSFPGSSMSENDPLPGLLQKVLSSWYIQDPEDTLDTVLDFTDKDPTRWAPRLFALIMPYLQQAQSGGRALPSAMARGVGDDPTALDPELTGRLWQVAESSVETPQDVRRDVDHLFLLFSALFSRLTHPSDQVLRSLVLTYSVQPLVFEQLAGALIFQDNTQKRAIYDQLLQEWNTSCVAVQERIDRPEAFRLPKVKKEVESSVEILRRLRALLGQTQTFPTVAEVSGERSAGSGTSFSAKGEDAIRLFQEMDRSDRELYGE